jgi:hypothetical protein
MALARPGAGGGLADAAFPVGQDVPFGLHDVRPPQLR